MIAFLGMTGSAAAQGSTYAGAPPTAGALYTDGQTGRYLLGGTWLYRSDPADVGRSQGWWQDVADTTGWTPLTVPNSYNAGDLSPGSMSGYVGWYRRDFTLPTDAFASYVPMRARRWIIRFESVNYRATVWLNGRMIGSHAGTNLPFELDLSGLRAGTNRLVVRVDDRHSATDLPTGSDHGGWWNYGGILREVYLRAVQRADIAQVMVRPLLACAGCPATIEEQAQVRNVTAAPQTVQLIGSYGGARLPFGTRTIAPGASWTARAQVQLVHPHVWSLDHPTLYRATLSLYDRLGHTIGGYVTLSGVRSITVTPDGRLELNGRLVRLRGVELREESNATGAALNVSQLRSLMSWVRMLGATVIRSDPLNPEIEEMADRDGILIWSEIPVTQLVAPTLLGQPEWQAGAHRLLAADITANQNHPSVLLWSIGNELPTPATAAEASYIAGASALAHRLDPTRPVGMAVSDWPGVACQSAYAPLDVIGFNEYFGWFDAGAGATDDRDSLSPFLDAFRSCYPNKALFVSEFGFDGNRAGPVEERGTYAFQADAAAYHLRVFASKPWLSGAIYFILQDAAAFPGYRGGDPWPNPPFNEKGLVGLSGNLKPAFATVAALYHAEIQIAAASGPKSAGDRRGRVPRRVARTRWAPPATPSTKAGVRP
ncbi:MAG: glycoside hydrolase family 2 protein [Solirubrobacteraceae bacterium]